MTLTKTLILGVAALSLCACQTTAPISSPSETLLADIDTSTVSQAGTTTLLKSSDPTCLTFYKNTSAFVAQPAALSAGAPTGPSFGSTLLKTVVLGTLAGAVSGGVASVGIGSSFAEAALIGTASQVTYNAGDTVYDNIVGTTNVPETPEVPVLEPMQEIEKAAGVLGCPAPDTAAIAALKLNETDN